MRISEMLQAMASWLESPDNEALLLSEYNEDCLKVVAESCVEAAVALKKAAAKVEEIEPAQESHITQESLDGLASIATAFDASGNADLKKQASVIDELLLTIAAPPDGASVIKQLEENRLEELKKKYKNPRKEWEKENKIADAKKAIEKSNMTKTYNIMEAPLKTRYCPIHHGVMTIRVGESIVQCPLDKAVYNFETGYTLENGSKVPGGDVAQQTQGELPTHTMFDSREGRLQTNKV